MFEAQVNEKEVKDFRELISEKKNGFVQILDDDDYEIASKIIPSFENKMKDQFQFDGEYPVILRIGSGELKDVISSKDANNLELSYNIRRLTYGQLYKNETWRYSGFLARHYDWTAKEWCESWGDEQNNPFKTCSGCGKTYDDNENVYQGFVKQEKYGSKLTCMCKECAYEASDKVTDYTLDEDGEPAIQVWERNKEL